jgi:hypothetical protein
VITLRSDHLTVALDPDRGGEIRHVATARSANVIAYHDWDTPLSVDDGPAYGSTELDWLSRYHAGWQVLFPNAGAESVIDGVPVAFHGETSLARLRVLDEQDGSCVMRAVARLPLELIRTVRLAADRPALYIEETVRNLGAADVPFIWGHHATFPAIPGSRIDLPGAQFHVEPATPGPLEPVSGTWPLAQGTDGTTHDLSLVPEEQQVRLVYLADLSEHWVAVRPPTDAGAEPGRAGFALSWDGGTFPHMWLWLQNADPGFPWYGRARMLGLEPQRSWPFDGLTGAIERGQNIVLRAGETTSSWVTLAVFDDASEPVTGVSRSGAVTFAGQS